MDLRSPNPDEHAPTLADLFARTFSNYWERYAYVNDGYIAESPYDWDASRIGVVDGEVATHFGVWDLGMRIGPSVVRVAGIGAVATLEPHRGKGLMAQTAGDCVAGLDEAGYDVSLLFGIPNFYHRFGYVVASSSIRFAFLTRDIEPAPRAVQYESFEGDVTELADLYNRENEGVTGTYLRPTYRRNRKPKDFRVYRFDGGYVVCSRQDDTLQVCDCAGDPVTVLEIARQRATAELCPGIEFVFLPPRSRTGEYLQTLTHRRIADRRRGGGPMMKIVNLTRTIEKIAPVLSQRLAASPLHAYSGTLALYGDGDGVVVGVSSGSVGEISPASAGTTANGSVTGGAALVRLFVGDGDPSRVCRQSNIELDGDAGYLVPVLFPDQEPSTILWDHF
ncbi:MAG: GNAT family N-acetyltransferase [Spirochaetota bacterium]